MILAHKAIYSGWQLGHQKSVRPAKGKKVPGLFTSSSAKINPALFPQEA